MEAVKELVERSERITVVTGAGISAPSGLPTFRGKENSLWNDTDLMNRSHIDYIRADPSHIDEMWEYWGPVRDSLSSVEPNAAHLALVKAEEKHTVVIATQNVDGLHQKAGSSVVYELHGTLHRNRCLDECIDGISFDCALMKCPHCGGPARPAAIFFGELLPLQAISASDRAVQNADLFIMVGTSGMVYPTAAYVDVATRNRVPSLLINDQEWDYPHPDFSHKVFGPCEEILPELFGS